MKGYKVFNSDWTSNHNNFKFIIGESYKHNGNIGLCKEGFHFCQKASNCFNYYSFNSSNKVAEIEAYGNILHGEDKSVCEEIKIVREISWQELLIIVNKGKNNTGLCNTGNMNTGNCNTGDWNTGNRNTGDWNTGNRNTGNCNTGNRNTGDWNTGDCNTGDCNTGDWNTGDWNTINFSSGVFNTEQEKIKIFNNQSNLTLDDWHNTDAYWVLDRIQTIFWVNSNNMTIEEKELHPEYETTGGFLKVIHIVEASEKWWEQLTNEEKNIIKNIPNFNEEIFKNITGLLNLD